MEPMGAQGGEHRLCFRTWKLETNWPMLKTQLCHSFNGLGNGLETSFLICQLKNPVLCFKLLGSIEGIKLAHSLGSVMAHSTILQTVHYFLPQVNIYSNNNDIITYKIFK